MAGGAFMAWWKINLAVSNKSRIFAADFGRKSSKRYARSGLGT